MIYLKAFTVSTMKSGKKMAHQPKVIQEWSNEFLMECKFDLLDPKEARKFLRDHHKLPNGKKLPFNTQFGDDIVYILYIFGVPKELIETAYHYSGGKKTRYLNLFPGYDEKEVDTDGKVKMKWLPKHGSLREANQ